VPVPLPKKGDGLDLAQWPFLFSPNIRVMNKPDEVDQGKPRPKPPRSEEALRIIEEYVNDLREIIKKLRHADIKRALIRSVASTRPNAVGNAPHSHQPRRFHRFHNSNFEASDASFSNRALLRIVIRLGV
jgi:hypothetical protein